MEKALNFRKKLFFQFYKQVEQNQMKLIENHKELVLENNMKKQKEQEDLVLRNMDEYNRKRYHDEIERWRNRREVHRNMII